jgi:hypothetical protein
MLSLLAKSFFRLTQGGALILALATPALADDLPGAFHGNAYATFANIKAGPIAASLARSAFQGCPCRGTNGQTLTSETDDIQAGAILTANKTISTAFASKTPTSAEVQNTATVQGLNILNGLISADGMTAVASVSATAKTITASGDGSLFKNLVIAGQPIADNVPANTTLPLPGIGTVTLKKITPAGTFRKGGQILVEMIAIEVSTRNSLGLPLGTKLIVAHALAGYVRKQPEAVYGGLAFVAEATGNFGDDLKNKIGRAALVSIECQGTAGKTKTNSINTLTANGIMGLSDGVTTAFASPEGDALVSRTTASTASLNLLGGLIKLDGMQAVAQSSLQNGIATGSADGSGFTGLTVLGIPVPVTTPPNTKLTLPGIGSVTVNEQTISKDGSVTVNGLHVVVSTFNLLGLPVGSELLVAHASASALPF